MFFLSKVIKGFPYTEKKHCKTARLLPFSQFPWRYVDYVLELRHKKTHHSKVHYLQLLSGPLHWELQREIHSRTLNIHPVARRLRAGHDKNCSGRSFPFPRSDVHFLIRVRESEHRAKLRRVPFHWLSLSNVRSVLHLEVFASYSSAASPAISQICATALSNIIYAKKDRVFHQSKEAKEMYFLVSGAFVYHVKAIINMRAARARVEMLGRKTLWSLGAPKEMTLRLLWGVFRVRKMDGDTEEIPITMKLDQSTYVCEAALWLIWRTRGEMRLGSQAHPHVWFSKCMASLPKIPHRSCWFSSGSMHSRSLLRGLWYERKGIDFLTFWYFFRDYGLNNHGNQGERDDRAFWTHPF